MLRRQPSLPIRMQASARGEVVHMRMIDQIAGPGMKDTDQTDLSANITRVKCQFLRGFGRSLKEQGIQRFLIGSYQIAQLSRQGESQKEIRDGQE